MILPSDRRIVDYLLRLKLWRFGRHGLFRTPSLFPCWGTRWLYERMKRRQTHDGLHHAPMCHGNEWSGAQLVVMHCNCGAARMAAKAKLSPARSMCAERQPQIPGETPINPNTRANDRTREGEHG